MADDDKKTETKKDTRTATARRADQQPAGKTSGGWTEFNSQNQKNAPEEGRKYMVYAAESQSGSSIFEARYEDGKFLSAVAGGFSRFEPGVTHFRDPIEGPK